MVKLTHAGAIAVRKDGDQTLVLVVTAKRHRKRWVFPKGHIEPGETPEVTALRELREEAGVEGDIAGFAGFTSVNKDGKKGQAAYYVVSYRSEVPAEEARHVQWLSVKEARAILHRDDAKRLLDEAAQGL